MFYEKMYLNMDYFHFRLNESFPAHIQNTVEMIYVLEGEVEVTVDRKSGVIGPGGMAMVFPYQAHSYSIENGRCFLAVAVPECFVSLETVLRTEVPCSPFCCFTGSDRKIADGMIAVLRSFADTDGEQDFYPLNDVYRKNQLSALAAFYLDRVGTEFVREQPDMPIIRKVMHMIEEKYLDPDFSIEETARSIGITRQHLSNILRTNTGCTAVEMLHRMRIEYSLTLLSGTAKSVSEIALASGFSSIRSFNRVFAELMGMSPGEYRRLTGKRRRG